jgi:hypothetical protein
MGRRAGDQARAPDLAGAELRRALWRAASSIIWP